MSEPREVEIIEAVDVFSADPARTGKKDTWITYKTADGRAYMITLPAESATEQEIQKRIREAEAKRTAIIGKKFTV